MTRQASPPSILKLRYMLRNARSGHGSVWGLNVQRQTFAEPPRRRIAPRQRRDADGRRQAKEPSPAHVAPSLSQARGFHVDPVTTALASASSASTMTTPMPPRCVALFLSCKIIFVICEIKVEWRGQCHSAPEKRLRLTYPSGRTADNLCLHLRPNFPERHTSSQAWPLHAHRRTHFAQILRGVSAGLASVECSTALSQPRARKRLSIRARLDVYLRRAGPNVKFDLWTRIWYEFACNDIEFIDGRDCREEDRNNVRGPRCPWTVPFVPRTALRFLA